jgi:hypothetical protein
MEEKYNYSCDICKVRLRVKIIYDYFNGICPVCRKSVPKHIPQEQVEKWLKQRNTDVDYVTMP